MRLRLLTVSLLHILLPKRLIYTSSTISVNANGDTVTAAVAAARIPTAAASKEAQQEEKSCQSAQINLQEEKKSEGAEEEAGAEQH